MPRISITFITQSMGVIKATAPLRISLMGGGTDTEPYKSLSGGAVVSLAINIYQSFTLYVDDDMKFKNEVPYGCDEKFFFPFTKKYGIGSMHHCNFKSESDGGINGGLGSSASVSVAALGAIRHYKGVKLERTSLAKEAWELENKENGLYGGLQDQMAASYGGLNLFEFTDKETTVQTFNREFAERLIPNLVLMHTNIVREDPKVQEGMKSLSDEQKNALDQIKSLVAPTIQAIGQGDIQILGEILDTAWGFKKKSNKVSNPRIDNIYSNAKHYGAIGGKLCGAGGGGHMVFVVKEKQDFIEKMEKEGLTNVDFSPDWNGVSVRIL